MIIKKSRKQLWTTLFSVIFGFVGVMLLNVGTNQVQAVNMNMFSNKLTNPKDVEAGGNPGKIDLHLKNVTDIAVVDINNVAAYFKSGVTHSGGVRLKITDGRNGRVCTISNKAPNGNVVVTIDMGPGKITKRTVDIKKVCGTNSSTKNQDKFFGTELAFPSGKLLKDDKVGMAYAKITVKFDGKGADSDDMDGSNSYALNYNMELVGPNSNNGTLSLRSSGNGGELGLRSSYSGNPSAAPSRKVQASVVFGFPCDAKDGNELNSRSSRAVKLYDADAVFGKTFMWIEENGNKLDKDDYDDKQDGDRIDYWDKGKSAWELLDSNGSLNTISIKKDAIKVNATYRVFVLNTGIANSGSGPSAVNPHSNTLSLTTPYDSIYGAKKCNYELKPLVNPPEKSGETFVEGTVVPVTGNISVDGFDNDNHDWSLSVRTYKNKPGTARVENALAPCDFKAGNVGVCTDSFASGNRKFNSDFSVDRDFDTSGVNPGNWVCFMMSVKKPEYGANANKWEHSPMKCIGVKGDVSGTTVDPPTYSYYPDIDVTSIADNLGNYPRVDDFMGEEYKRKYPWRIIEAKFTAMPTSSIGEAQGDACDTIQANYSSTLIAGSCKDDINTGDDLFPNDNEKQKVTANNVQKNTPDPIGTWTCYTMRYRNNPKPLDSLEADIEWFVDDNNDNDSVSENSRWSDGYSYEHYHDTSYPDPVTGVIIPDGFTHAHGSPVSKSTYWDPLLVGTSPATYTYTDFERTSCSVAGINPKVQIRGGDLRASGDVIASTTDITPPAQYRGMYGSFGEYGLLSDGLVIRMASGAGFNGSEELGAAQFDWSKLTFSNESTTPEPKFGVMGAGVTHSFNYTNPIEITGDLTVNSINDLYTPESKRLVYVVEGNLYITGNLAYANNYNTTEQLPRIAIKARNIIIAPSVDRIDPWLITDTDGVLNTCGTASFDPDDRNSFSNTTLITTDAQNSQCDNNGVPLVFNGPVIAGKVYLLRTAGSRDSYPAPSAEGRESLTQPAEIFNIRPDAYLSSFSNNITPHPVAATDRVIDLPPRF